MKILILTPYAPCPPNSGGRLRIWEQIRYLGTRHTLTLISFYQTEEEYDQHGMLAEYCHRVILVKRPDTLEDADLLQMKQVTKIFQWYSTTEMKQALEIVRSDNFDIVLFEHIFMAQYQALFSTCTILQEHNIESNIFKQIAQLYSSSGPTSSRQKENAFRKSRWMLMRRYEDETWPKFPLRVTVSEDDKKELDQRCPTGRTVVIENGINTSQVRLIPTDHWQSEQSRRILFMGSLDFYPNIDSLFVFTQQAQA